MRRAGANPTDVEVTDIINKIDNDTGALDFQVLCLYIIGIQNLFNFFSNFVLLCRREIR